MNLGSWRKVSLGDEFVQFAPNGFIDAERDICSFVFRHEREKTVRNGGNAFLRFHCIEDSAVLEVRKDQAFQIVRDDLDSGENEAGQQVGPGPEIGRGGGLGDELLDGTHLEEEHFFLNLARGGRVFGVVVHVLIALSGGFGSEPVDAKCMPAENVGGGEFLADRRAVAGAVVGCEDEARTEGAAAKGREPIGRERDRGALALGTERDAAEDGFRRGAGVLVSPEGDGLRAAELGAKVVEG